MEENTEMFLEAKRLNYIFEGPFELSAINDAISFLNSSDLPVNFFINSPGGYVSYVYPMSKAIEEYGDIILYPIEDCSSSGFFLLLNTSVPICLLDKSIRSLIHFPRIDAILDMNKNHIYDKVDFKNKLEQKGFSELLRNLPLPDKQMKKLLKGEDVVLYYNDLLEIFKTRIIHE
jgi:hypothetical protein